MHRAVVGYVRAAERGVGTGTLLDRICIAYGGLGAQSLRMICRRHLRRHRADNIFEHVYFVYLLRRRGEHEYRVLIILCVRFCDFIAAFLRRFCAARCGERADKQNGYQNDE